MASKITTLSKFQSRPFLTAPTFQTFHLLLPWPSGNTSLQERIDLLQPHGPRLHHPITTITPTIEPSQLSELLKESQPFYDHWEAGWRHISSMLSPIIAFIHVFHSLSSGPVLPPMLFWTFSRVANKRSETSHGGLLVRPPVAQTSWMPESKHSDRSWNVFIVVSI